VALRRLARGAAEAWEVPRDLLLGRYPAFVTGGPLRQGEIPVFVFHGAEPDAFGRKLRHLADNGYETLAVDDYVAMLRGERPAPPKSVLLTFDDGRGSVWSVAAPILRRHAMKAVVFLVPGRVGSRPGLGPTIGDADGLPHGPAILRETGEAALMSWQEIEALARGDVFEFHSHTHSHARVHTAPILAGFANPRSRQGYDAFDQPLVRAKGRDLLGEDVPLGTPLLRSTPRTAESLRFFEDEALRRACIDAVAEGGGEGFFRHSDWETRLRRLLRGARLRGRIETPDERALAIGLELTESKRVIEQHTGRPVTHLCYPWHAAGPTARRLAVEAGYRTAFCGKVTGAPITLPGGDPGAIARLGEDYVELLPGKGRATLAEVLRRKWARRFGTALR
jgi:peptidoglycan/xylan/chitin deacetylase (PgdA/CDA1 family)